MKPTDDIPRTYRSNFRLANYLATKISRAKAQSAAAFLTAFFAPLREKYSFPPATENYLTFNGDPNIVRGIQRSDVMQFPSTVAWISNKTSNAFSVRSVSGRWLWTGLLLMLLAGYFIYQAKVDLVGDRDLEVRLDFIPFQPRREFRDSLSMTLRGNGKVRVVHHRREMYVDAVYEGTLPEADALRLVARARQAAALKGHLSTRDDALFRMVVLPAGSSDEKSVFGGQLGDAPKSTRDLVEELLVLWNRLDKATPAEAYVRTVPFVEPELKRMQKNEQRRFLSVSEFPADLQQIVTDSLNRPRDFVPITRAQHDQLLHYRQFVLTANGFSHRLALLLPAPNPTN